MAAQNSYAEISRTSLTDLHKYKEYPDASDIESTAKAAALDEGTRLRMLGYDVVLGRPLGFWSSTAMNFCHMSFFFEFMTQMSSLAYTGPLVFLIGYPIAAVFQLILMGPFCEMVSAFPVAGAMATWSWQCARKGIRHERQWGYLIGGIVLTMHMAKIIFFMYNFSVSMEGVIYQVQPIDQVETEKQLAVVKWKILIYVIFVTVVAILCLTRLSQNHIFWIVAAAVNIGWFIVGLTCMGLSVPKLRKTFEYWGWLMTRTYGFGEWVRENWTHGMPWMIFVALPLRVTAIDASAHMSEETKNPSKTVPRAMYTSAVTHHILTYALSAVFIVTNGSLDARQQMANLVDIDDKGVTKNQGTTLMANPWIAVNAPMVSGMIGPALQFAAFGWIGLTQATAAVTITSRFVFALARENGIPFSVLLVKTDRHRMPWVAMVVIFCALYLSTAGMFVDMAKYYNLIQSTAVNLINVAYVIPLFLYVTTRVDFARDERTEFSLRGLGKPFAIISLLYLTVATVQGSMPISIYNYAQVAPHLKVDTISAFPIVLPALLVIMLISWLLYGRNHYIGPIRGLTKYTTGLEVDPLALDPSQHKNDALRKFINMALGETSSGGSVTRVGQTSKSKGSRSRTVAGSNFKSPLSGKFFSFRSDYTRAGSNPISPLSPGSSSNSPPYTKDTTTFGVPPESQLLPGAGATTNGALAESALLPGQTMDPALAESNILPEPTVHDGLLPPKEAKPSGRGRKIMSRIPMSNLKQDKSMTLGSHRGEAALAESQLDYQSRFNPAASGALQESQLLHATQHDPAAALEESQLYHETQYEPSALHPRGPACPPLATVAKCP